jgi:predicted permease
MWISRLFRRNALERDLQREMQFHLEAAVADHVRGGLSPDEARRRARIEFGGPEQMKELTRDARGTAWLEDFVGDARFAVRGLRRSPAFATAAVLTIAIGVGANTAVWSITDALMRRSLPIDKPEQLHALRRAGLSEGFYLMSHPLMLAMQKELGSSAELAGMGSISRVYATIADRPEGVLALPVSGNFFEVVGIGAAAGRVITPADDRELGASPVIAISDGFWERRFNRDPSVVGRKIRINGFPVTIVGVTKAGFSGLNVSSPVDVYAPLAMHHALNIRGSNRNSNADNTLPWIPQRGIFWLTVVTRADPDALPRIAQQVNRAFRADLVTEYADRDSVARASGMKERVEVEAIPRGFSTLRNEFRDPLRALFAGVALILLLTCANLAGLVLARGESRGHEMAIRASLGAKSSRLARQMAAESLTLAIIGGALGLLMAQWMVGALLLLASTGSSAIPLDARLNGPVLLFAFGVTLLAGLVVGLAPALRARRPDLAATFKAGGRIATAAHRLPLGRLLVTAQIALALILVTSAGVFARTFGNLMTVDAGYERETVVTARIDPRAAGYTRSQLPALYEQLLRETRGLAGVQSVSLGKFGLGRGERTTSGFAVPGKPLGEKNNVAQENWVSPGYFHTVGIPLRRGREFTTADVIDHQQVVVVSENFATHFLGTANAIGKRFGYGDANEDPTGVFEVVGVVPDVHNNGLKEKEPWMVYHALAQDSDTYAQSLDVRVSGRPEPVIGALRAAIGKVDRNLPVPEVVTVGSLIERGLSRERLVARLAGGFGILALVLAAIGLYGVVSYSVARRTNEMGVRLALGASPGGVSWLVLRDSLGLVTGGLIAGVVLWFPVLGLTRTLVYGVSPHDPALLAASVGVLVFAGVLAGLIPAWRAAHIDPIEAIRAD